MGCNLKGVQKVEIAKLEKVVVNYNTKASTKPWRLSVPTLDQHGGFSVTGKTPEDVVRLINKNPKIDSIVKEKIQRLFDYCPPKNWEGIRVANYFYESEPQRQWTIVATSENKERTFALAHHGNMWGLVVKETGPHFLYNLAVGGFTLTRLCEWVSQFDGDDCFFERYTQFEVKQAFRNMTVRAYDLEDQTEKMEAVLVNLGTDVRVPPQRWKLIEKSFHR